MTDFMRMRGSVIATQADALAGAGRVGDAYRLLTSPAAAINPDALFLHAQWRLAGGFVRRDLAAARDLFRRAAERGHGEAARAHRAFLAGGIGGPPDWPLAMRMLEQAAAKDRNARAQIALIHAMSLSEDGGPMELPAADHLSQRPGVRCFRGLLSAAECDFLVSEAAPWLAPAVVIDPQTGRQMRNPVRTSDSMSIGYVDENPAINALNRRIAAATGTGLAQGEPLQVLRYRPGQEYKPHFDALPPGSGNQRVLTAIAYLSDDYEGGETLFVTGGLRFRGAKGDLLVFDNALPDGRPDPDSQHAGLPVTSGTKLIATRWIRAAPFVFPPPRPMLDI